MIAPMKSALVPLSALAALWLSAGQAGAFSCPDLEADTRRAMTGWQVPGLALGIVRDAETVLRRTFGLRDTETALPVTPETVFGIGSLTKSFTALGVTIAEAEGRLSLDRPVRRLLDYFPGDITLRHLLSHNAGWPRHDALWYLDRYKRAELPRKLALLPRFANGGGAFQYNNVPFAAAGMALSAATETTWDAWITAKILSKTGMTRTVTTVSGFRNVANRASPYFPAREGRVSLPLRDTDPVAPAAGLYAPLTDMLRYTSALANNGQIDGEQALPASAVQAVLARKPGRYGLGFRLASWRGSALAFHPGFIDGYGARLSLLPDRNAGVVVLTNMSGETPVARIVSQIVLDCLVAAPRTDWVARFGGARKSPKPEPPPPAPAPPDRRTDSYIGAFLHPAYGAMAFSANPGNPQLSGTFHGRKFTLDYAGMDRWRLTETHWPLREGLIFTFRGWAETGFASVSAPLADGPTYRHNAGPLIFRRQALSSPASAPD